MYQKNGMAGDSIEGFLKHFNTLTPKLCSFETLPIFVGYGINFSDDKAKEAVIEAWVKHLKINID